MLAHLVFVLQNDLRAVHRRHLWNHQHDLSEIDVGTERLGERQRSEWLSEREREKEREREGECACVDAGEREG